MRAFWAFCLYLTGVIGIVGALIVQKEHALLLLILGGLSIAAAVVVGEGSGDG